MLRSNICHREDYGEVHPKDTKVLVVFQAPSVIWTPMATCFATCLSLLSGSLSMHLLMCMVIFQRLDVLVKD